MYLLICMTDLISHVRLYLCGFCSLSKCTVNTGQKPLDCPQTGSLSQKAKGLTGSAGERKVSLLKLTCRGRGDLGLQGPTDYAVVVSLTEISF